MEPRIQYASTSDGVSIAYWSIGEGLPIVNPPPAMPWSHIELEWQIPEWRHFYEHLADNYRVIRYDSRGAGLSSRQPYEYSLETHLLDLEAVVDRLGLDTFALFGVFFNVPVVIEYAARHPERVSHIMSWCGIASGADVSRPAHVTEHLEKLLTLDYELFTETLAHTFFGWSEGEAAHRFAVYMRDSLTPEQAQSCWGTNATFDVTARLPTITQPTLVMHRRDFPMLDIESSKRMAASIPDARLRVFDGSSLSPYMGDMRVVVDAIDDFLGLQRIEGRAPLRHAHDTDVIEHPAAVPGGFRTIMFTDMEGSTGLTQRLGDERAQDLIRLHNTIVGSALYAQGGTLVKHTGDGIMASFPTASGAIECAIAIQRAFASHNDAAPAELVNVRIGINAGEPVAEGDDLFGTAVQLASRVCARADAGEILTSDVVRQLVAGKGFLFADRGEAELRGFEDPVRIYDVRWREDRG